MDPTLAALLSGLAAAVTALAWVVVRRLRVARRIMPRVRARGGFSFSMRTPETDPPPALVRRRFEPLSLEQPGTAEPLEVELIPAPELEPQQDLDPRLSERPTRPPPAGRKVRR